MQKIFVMGLGEIGYNAAKYYRQHDCKVFGWDISKDARDVASKEGIMVYELLSQYDWDQMDVITICVSTNAVFDVACQFVHELGLLDLKRKPLFIIESTVIPETCKRVYESVFMSKLGIAHIPQRFWAADPYGRGVRRKRVVAASDDHTFIRAIHFLKSVNMPTFPVYGLEVAELSKVAENAYRYVMIAYAEELFGVCSELNIDFWAVKEAIETHQSIGYILEPRKGIGGHCLPMAAAIMEIISDFNHIISAARNADELYREQREYGPYEGQLTTLKAFKKLKERKQ